MDLITVCGFYLHNKELLEAFDYKIMKSFLSPTVSISPPHPEIRVQHG